jgi:hypothetical protein
MYDHNELPQQRIVSYYCTVVGREMLRQAIEEVADTFTCDSRNIFFIADSKGGACWRSWLMHCATSRGVAGFIPDGFIETYSFWPKYGPVIN